MKIGVSLKINVDALDMNRLFAGKKGRYLDATVFIDIDQLGEYGDNGMITQDVTKEEKAQGVKGVILGNCKVFWNDSQAQSPQQTGFQQAPQQAPVQQGFQQSTQQQTGNASKFQSAPPQSREDNTPPF